MKKHPMRSVLEEAAHNIWKCAVDAQYADAKEIAAVAKGYLDIVIQFSDSWISDQRCPACVQRPHLRQTGWGEKMRCPVCKFEFDPANPSGEEKVVWGGKAYVPKKYQKAWWQK